MNPPLNTRIPVSGLDRVEVLSIPVRSDWRGFVVFPFQEMGVGPDGVLGFHFVTVESGAVRGNHRHPENIEYLLLLSGEWRVAVRNPQTGETEPKEFSINSLTRGNIGRDRPLVLIPADWPHAIQNTGEETGSLICFYLNPEKINHSPSGPDLSDNRKSGLTEVETIRDTVIL
jgi:dTDP-4-dehydrorhamnose 3,5-epimerase-like enzyme